MEGGRWGNNANIRSKHFLLDKESFEPPSGMGGQKRTHRPLLLLLPLRQKRGSSLMICA